MRENLRQGLVLESKSLLILRDGTYIAFVFEPSRMRAPLAGPGATLACLLLATTGRYIAVFLPFTTRYVRPGSRHSHEHKLCTVTTRTTTLVTVPHSSFVLRFSSLVDVENACHEDEEQRATRTLDWIGERINQRCAKWTEDMEKKPGRDSARSPWWDELWRCSEADHVPSKIEGWNHPVSS